MNSIKFSVCISFIAAVLFASLLAILAPAQRAQADGLIVIVDPHHHHPPVRRPHPPHWPNPRPIPPRVYRFAPMQVVFHHVTVTIKDQVAITEVDQEFYNPNNARLEGHYIFPLPKGAAIDKFSMDINGKQQQAELLDATKARKIYTDIVRKMKDPALMEYADRGMFTVRIFPIEPHSKKRVKIKYTQVLKSDSNLVGYSYPLNTEKFSSAPIKTVSVKYTIDSKRPIKTVYSPSHKVEVARKGSNKAVIGWEVKNAKPDKDFHIYFSTEKDKDIAVDLLAHNNSNGKKGPGEFMLFISPGLMSEKQIAKKDVVFVLDTSGSMAGKKMEQAKKALNFCIANLNNGDRFEIIRFSTEAESLFDDMKKVDKDSRETATDFVNALKPIGGTAIQEALVLAAKTVKSSEKKGRPTMVIFLTDGRPTIGETNEDAIVKTVTKAVGDKTVRVFCFGIGTDINTHLLDKITDHTKAVSQYVLPQEDIEVKVSNFFTKISHPVLAGIDLKIKGDVRVTQMYPSTIPDLFHGDQLIVLGKYENKSGDKTVDAAIQLTGYMHGKKQTLTYETAFPKKQKDNGFIPRLWATRRVGYLLEQIRLHGASSELKDEVSTLARRYGIVTPYNSYLILEDEAKQPARPRLSRAPVADDGTRFENNAKGRAQLAVAQKEQKRKAGEAFNRFRDDRSGVDAVAGAKFNEALKKADLADADAEAATEVRKALASKNAPGSTATRPTDPFHGRSTTGSGNSEGQGRTNGYKYGNTTHISKFIAGRTFYFNGTAWVDSLVTEIKGDAKPTKIKFNSDKYFELMTKHADASKWLSLGKKVVIVIAGEVFEIEEELEKAEAKPEK